MSVCVCVCVYASMGMGVFLFQLDKFMKTGQLSGDCQIHFTKFRTHSVQNLFYFIWMEGALEAPLSSPRVSDFKTQLYQVTSPNKTISSTVAVKVSDVVEVVPFPCLVLSDLAAFVSSFLAGFLKRHKILCMCVRDWLTEKHMIKVTGDCMCS